MPLAEDKECYEALKPVSPATREMEDELLQKVADRNADKAELARLLSTPGDPDEVLPVVKALREKIELAKTNIDFLNGQIMISLDQDREDWSDMLSDIRKEHIADREQARENLESELKRLFEDKIADKIFRKFGKLSRAEVESSRVKDQTGYNSAPLKAMRAKFRALTSGNATERENTLQAIARAN